MAHPLRGDDKKDYQCFDRFNRPLSTRNVKCVAEEGVTHQEFKDECDINRIMAKALSTGQFPPNISVGRYGDFSDTDDFQAAQELLKRAEGQFSALPSKVRERFKNDPALFLAWVDDKANLEEAQELGILSEEGKKRLAADVEAKKAAAAAVKPPEVKPPA